MYQDHDQKERAKEPAIVIRDVPSFQKRVLIAPGFWPRWFPSGSEIAVFLPDNLVGGRIFDKGLSEPFVTQYAAEGKVALPGKTIVVDLNGQIRQEIPNQLLDMDRSGRRFLMRKPIVVDGESFERRRSDLLLYDRDTQKESVILTGKDIVGRYPNGRVIDANLSPRGDEVYFLVETSMQSSSDNRTTRRWQLCYMQIGTPTIGEIALPGMARSPGGSEGPDFLALSPDGKRLLLTDHANSKQIKLLDLNSGRVETVYELDGHGWVSEPTWSRDGRHILFNRNDSSDVSGSATFWIKSLATGKAQRLFPRTWRNVMQVFVLTESDHFANVWQPD